MLSQKNDMRRDTRRPAAVSLARTFRLEDRRPAARQLAAMQSAADGSAKVNQLQSRAGMANASGVVQRLVAVIGKESDEHPHALANDAQTLVTRFNEPKYYTEQNIKSGDFTAPHANETIYLVAHGDDTSLEITTEAALGDKNGAAIKDIVKNILKKFKRKNPDEKFSGRIILEGCHTAEPVTSSRSKSKSSLLFDLQAAMRDDRYFDQNMAPETRIGGYLGQAFTTGDYNNGYGTANTEHPGTIRYQHRNGITGVEAAGGISYDNTESHIESNWKQHLRFGAPGK